MSDTDKIPEAVEAFPAEAKAEYDAHVASALSSLRGAAEAPLPAEIQGFGSTEGLQIVKREVVVDEHQCGAGHNHRDIMLVHTFSKAAAAEPVTGIDAALEEFHTKALAAPPAGSVGIAEFDASRFAQISAEGDLQVVLALQTAFETAASLELAAQQPQQAMSLEELLAMISGGGRGPGSSGMN